jgi:ABC-type phosphate/phosphonate transport system ATPase subunit
MRRMYHSPNNRRGARSAQSQAHLTLSAEAEAALTLLESSQEPVFVTGRAGTGKSTLLRIFRERTKQRLVVLAPTGVAAVNVQGQTVHSFLALVGFQGRGFAEVVRPDFFHPLLLAALLFQRP